MVVERGKDEGDGSRASRMVMSLPFCGDSIRLRQGKFVPSAADLLWLSMDVFEELFSCKLDYYFSINTITY